MRVKKFEAKTMQEALRSIKEELGPDAIILSARDIKPMHNKPGGVEVTAAISEVTLRKKEFVESRMNSAKRSQFREAPARIQREIIENVVNERLAAQRAPVRGQPAAARPVPATNYIDIPDDLSNQGGVTFAAGKVPASPSPDRAQARIRNATREALQSFSSVETSPGGMRSAPRDRDTAQVRNLQAEIDRLQQVIQTYQNSPATLPTHPGSQFGLPAHLAPTYQRLIDVGVDTEIAGKLLVRAGQELDANQQKRKAFVDAWVAKYILGHINIIENPVGGRLHLFMGPPGSGKTTTLVKFAGQLVVQKKRRIAIATCDTQKVGAIEQMKTFAQILNVPFAILRGRSDWEWLWDQAKTLDYILVDFPGLQLKAQSEIDTLNSILPPAGFGPTSHLVLSAVAKDSDSTEVARRYHLLNFQDFIFTNLDASLQHGVIWNLHDRFGKPLHSFGTGSRIPEDFEFASKERVLDLIYKLSKISHGTRGTL